MELSSDGVSFFFAKLFSKDLLCWKNLLEGKTSLHYFPPSFVLRKDKFENSEGWENKYKRKASVRLHLQQIDRWDKQ